MVSKRTLTIGSWALIGVVATVLPSLGQSIFPIRFDPEAITGAEQVVAASGMAIETGRHYSKSFTYDANPLNTSVDVLDIIATEDDTTVAVRILVASSKSDTIDNGSMRELVVRAKFNADLGVSGQWTGFLSKSIFDENTNGQIGISFNVAGSGPLEIAVTGGFDHDRITVMLEVVANQDVTFEEFTAPT